MLGLNTFCVFVSVELFGMATPNWSITPITTTQTTMLANLERKALIAYLKEHPDIQDILKYRD
jgi:hypothetical protein